jgi:transcription factor C subunit 6
VRVKTKVAPKANVVGTGAWPSEVGVHRVTWNSSNGLAAAGLLASATASGLCRVDELWGRWMKGKVPYAGIEHIRMELAEDADAMEVDSDESAASL